MKQLLVLLLTLSVGVQLFAKEEGETFKDGEANFKLVMQKILDKYYDKNITRDDLYRGATAGMLNALNSGDQTWNKLLTPLEMHELETELSSQISGTGLVLTFNADNGHGQVLKILPNSPAETSGVKAGDEILTVDGKKFKGQGLLAMAMAIRGGVGEPVTLKILRDDSILKIPVKRGIVTWDPVDFQTVGAHTALLTIDYFNEKTPSAVEQHLEKVNQKKIKKLIVDLRDNSGGGFDQAVKTAELFVAKGEVVASTKDRDGNSKVYKSQRGLLDAGVEIVVIVNRVTSSGAELLTAALKDQRHAKLVGENTHGKWNAQTLEKLPNQFAVKYTVNQFFSPTGKSYGEVGLHPDLEVTISKETGLNEMRAKHNVQKRLTLDPQLKAAVELISAKL